MRDLISRAFKLPPRQVIGPDWLDDSSLNFAAYVPPGTAAGDIPHLLQMILAHRFKLVAHRKTRTMKVFLLEVANGGVKLDETPSWNVHLGIGTCEPRRRWSVCQMTSMPELASRLEKAWAVSPIFDRTGLKGVYDFILLSGQQFDMGADRDAPVKFKLQAIQEQIKSLGLMIEQRTETANVLVVDHCEKKPINQ